MPPTLYVLFEVFVGRPKCCNRYNIKVCSVTSAKWYDLTYCNVALVSTISLSMCYIIGLDNYGNVTHYQ